MEEPLLRTYATALTDDELILLDVLFDGGACFRLLRRSGFRSQWNCSPHKLSDDQLRETLNRFVDDGLLTTEQHDHRTFFYLTPEGGRRWEMERLPVWHRYATDRYHQSSSGQRRVRIRSVSPQCRDEFWRIGCEVGMFAYANGRLKRFIIRNHRLISWKTFPCVYVLIAVLDDSWSALDWDWEAYEAGRTWWRVVSESNKFWRDTA